MPYPVDDLTTRCHETRRTCPPYHYPLILIAVLWIVVPPRILARSLTQNIFCVRAPHPCRTHLTLTSIPSATRFLLHTHECTRTHRRLVHSPSHPSVPTYTSSPRTHRRPVNIVAPYTPTPTHPSQSYSLPRSLRSPLGQTLNGGQTVIGRYQQ